MALPARERHLGDARFDCFRTDGSCPRAGCRFDHHASCGAGHRRRRGFGGSGASLSPPPTGKATNPEDESGIEFRKFIICNYL